jgi:Cu(I)/Ag(I) efflux system membrane fusion protein/cobalt-zinc-cadmium efflux system membrane fusion protein
MMWLRRTVGRLRLLIWPAALILMMGVTSVFLASCKGEEKVEEASSQEAQLWTCGMHPEVIVDEPGNCPICGMNLVPVKQEVAAQRDTAGMAEQVERPKTTEMKDKKILYWRAPMDPTYITDKPGKSPMGMDLIPVYEGEEELAGGATITIDPVTVQNIGVQTTPVEMVDLSRVIRTVGHLDYDEKKLHRVNLKFSGWIEKLYVDETGQQVRRGEPILEIYSPDLVATQEEYLLAVRNMKRLEDSPFKEISASGRSLLESTRRRLLYWDITEKQITDLEEKGIVSKTVTLHSPVDGVVISKMAEQGMQVKAGMDLYRIADLTSIWVYAHIYEYEVPWVKVGQSVEMELPYVPGKTFQGKVDYIYPYLDQKSRDVKVRLVYPNPDLELKPQMYANVRLEAHIGTKVVAVPGEAVIRSGKRNVVFVSRGGGKFEPRDVILGPEGQNDLIQVLAGVRHGEEVVTSAQFLLDSESRLKEAIQKMLEARKASKPMQKDQPQNQKEAKRDTTGNVHNH